METDGFKNGWFLQANCMKKIIFIHLLNDYSGSPKVLSQVIQSLQKNDGIADIYSGYSDKGFLSNITQKHHFYFYKRFNSKYITLITFVLSQIHLFFKLLKLKNEDVIFYVNTMLPFGAALAGKVIGKPVYYHIHETSLRPPILKKILRFVVKKTAKKIVFVSQSVFNSESFDKKQQYIIPNTLSNNFIKQASYHSYQWQYDGCFNILMVCSLKVYKGILEFIELAKRLQNQPNIRFILVLNADQLEINNFLSTINKSTNVEIISRQTELIPFYQKASLLLNLSRIDEWVETFGLTILEALAFGIPVIVPPVGGPTEIVTEGNEGFLISSYEVEKIAERISLLSRDKNECLRLSEKAKLRAQYFSPENFDKQIMQVLCE